MIVLPIHVRPIRTCRLHVLGSLICGKRAVSHNDTLRAAYLKQASRGAILQAPRRFTLKNIGLKKMQATFLFFFRLFSDHFTGVLRITIPCGSGTVAHYTDTRTTILVRLSMLKSLLRMSERNHVFAIYFSSRRKMEKT